MSPDPISTILAPPAYQLLQELTGAEDAPALLAQAPIDAPTRASLLTQLHLRQRAEEKFGRWARELIFTREGLEQATHLQVATVHAKRYLDAGIKTVADLGCGIGANAFALAGLGLRVQAWDRDPQAVAAALVNLRFFPDSSVQLGDVTALNLPDMLASGVEAIFADPARRTGANQGNRRLFNPSQWSPSWEQIMQWADVMAHAQKDYLGVKVAPGLDYRHLPAHYHAQWISRRGALADASVWSPGLAPEGPGRTALVLGSTGTLTVRVPGDPSQPATRIDTAPLREYLWEPDSAIIRAGALATYAQAAGAEGVISPGLAYLTSSHLPTGHWRSGASVFAVHEVVSMKTKALTSAVQDFCSRHQVSAVEVKKRGADLDPAVVQRQLNKAVRRACGPASTPADERNANSILTVVLTRLAGRHRALLCRRCPQPSSASD